MTLEKCLLTRNDCYRAYRKAAMTGIVIHSTGANNASLKRYVQPLKSDARYGELIKLLGENRNGNHWNLSYAAGETERQACVHAFIGRDASGRILTVQTLPYEICCWGVGDGRYGSYNYPPQARLQFEICEDDLKDEAYFNAAFAEAAQYCAYLCRRFGWGAERISSHYESYKAGYGGNHGDPDNWLKKFGRDMDWFRGKVAALLTVKEEEDLTKEEVLSLIEEAKEPVYHYWSEVPSWAQAPLRAMYDAGYFGGASPADLSLGRTKAELLVVIAGILKDRGILDY